MKGDDPVSRADYSALAHLQARWRNNPSIPSRKKESMIALVEILRKRVADNRNEIRGVQLYYPEDCRDYDVFMSVANALDALVIPTSGEGYIMRNIGEYSDIE